MRLFPSEADFLRVLKHHDDLLIACAAGDLPFPDFLAQYDDFSFRYALDGHESDAEEIDVLSRHSAAIERHLRFQAEVLAHLCTAEQALEPVYRAAGRISPDEALRRLRELLPSKPPDSFLC